jgi:hypothetical protein
MWIFTNRSDKIFELDEELSVNMLSGYEEQFGYARYSSTRRNNVINISIDANRVVLGFYRVNTHLKLCSGHSSPRGHELYQHDHRGKQIGVGVVQGELYEHGPSAEIQPVAFSSCLQSAHCSPDASFEVQDVAATLQRIDVCNVWRILQANRVLINPRSRRVLLLKFFNRCFIVRMSEDPVWEVGSGVIVVPVVLVATMIDEGLQVRLDDTGI